MARLDDPAGIREFLLTALWGYQTVGGRIVAEFCPVCIATVNSGAFEDGTTAKVAHVKYHVDMATLLRSLSRDT